MNNQEELQRAINHYEYRVNKRKEDIDVYRNSRNQELIMAADTFEQALERDTIILAALKAYQMKPVEPCELCRNVEELQDYFPLRRNKNNQIVRFRDGKHLLAITTEKSNGKYSVSYSNEIYNCPSCGRKLKDGE